MRPLAVLVVGGICLAGCSTGGPGSSARVSASPTPVPTTSSSASSPVGQRVAVHLCDTYDYAPAEITVACGDGNARVVRLRWSRWTATTALGEGTWQQNDCTPSCAAGAFHDYPVRLSLSEPTGTGTRRFFGRVVADFPAARPPYPAYTSGHTVLMAGGRPVP